MDSLENIQVAAFYRFVPLADPVALRQPITDLGVRAGVKGTVLLAPEGINATVAGSVDAVSAVVDAIQELEPFKKLTPKHSWCSESPFQRWRVRLKKEIVSLREPDGNPFAGVGTYVSPEHWDEVVRKSDAQLIDVRNDYEIECGAFANAINPSTSDFSDFPAFVDLNLLDKTRAVAMYCTGGIRCEKATAYLIAKGFGNVLHLEGGILAYLERVPKENSTWQGNCFVFDDRRALDHDLRPVNPLSRV